MSKQSFLSSFDFDYNPSELFMINTKELNETFFKERTFRQLMDELSYNDDLQFHSWGLKDSKLTFNEIKVGKNRMKNLPVQKENATVEENTIVEVELIKVPLLWQGGICYILQFENVENWTGKIGRFLVEHSKNLKASDIPKSFTMYMTPR